MHDFVDRSATQSTDRRSTSKFTTKDLNVDRIPAGFAIKPKSPPIDDEAQNLATVERPVEAHFERIRSLRGYQWRAKLKGQFFKRCLDIIASSLLIVVLSPVLVLVGIFVRLHDGAPALYRQRRVGLHGQTFDCLKFRTMVKDADARLKVYLAENPVAAEEWEQSRKLRNDPRVTPIGRFLRRSSIDELPQLFNVLKGEMSLVGPRPVVEVELEKYGLQAIHYLNHRPGISGLWQVSGRSDTDYATRVGYDRQYALSRSFWGDVIIMLRTVQVVLTSRGAM